MGSKRNVDMSTNSDTVKIVETDAPTDAIDNGSVEVATPAATKANKTKVRSKKYITTRSNVDKTKLYDPFAAIELVKRLSYSSFDGTIIADLVVREVGAQIELTFPHATGKTTRVEIASDDLLNDIEAGKIEFDILLSAPEMMLKLAKHARVLGPRGLMPNPKNGTVTDDPKRRKTELEKGIVTIKTERKQPLMHVTIGKVSMETKDLVENFNALIEALGPKVRKASLSASMSPAVKVKIV
ncbi:MAG: hypothetical protein WDZ94_04740 [Patescibacteria group bacterium]